MASNRADSLLSLFNREPEQSQFLLKFGLGGPVVIVVWHLLGGYFLPVYALAPLTLVIILLYGAATALLTFRLVHNTDRWQMESAEQSRRLLGSSTTGRRMVAGELDSDDVAIPPPPPASFPQVYFLMRLQEEVMRCRREGTEMSVIALDATRSGEEPGQTLIEKTSFEIATLAAGHSRTISLPLSVSATEYIFCLPNSDRAFTEDFVSKLVRALGDYWCHFGVAVYPEDGTDGESLFNHARQECEASRQDKQRRARNALGLRNRIAA